MSLPTRRFIALAAVTALSGALIAAPAAAEPVAPTIAPSDGAWVRGATTLTALPGQRGDAVTGLTLGGESLPTSTELGHAELSFDVGSNSIEARYESYVLINDNRLDLDRDMVNERVALEFPNSWLLPGENSLEWRVGTFETSCGTNYDDYVVWDLAVETGGPVAMDGDRKLVYSMGDGNCGSNTSLLTEFDITFTIGDDPATTPGLRAEVDTTALPNGSHTVTATTASGGTASQVVRVNNDPADGATISLDDGDVLGGAVDVTATPLGASPVDELVIDGDAVETSPTLGTGEAQFRFSIGSNSLEARYGNHVIANGFTVVIDERDIVNETYDLAVPKAYLVPGRNTIVFNTGTIQGSCGTNHDDFDLTGVALIVDGATVTNVEVAERYLFGDGNCGSNTTRIQTATMTFDVDAPDAASGLRATIDTTALPDGEHVLTATTAAGAVSQRTVTVDNSAPEITSTISSGDHLAEAVVLEVTATDANGVAGPIDIQLDGAPIANGSLVGPGLAEGAHTLVITATDALGNSGATTIGFTSAVIPEQITDPRAVALGEDIELSAAVDAAAGDVTATFRRAEAALPVRAFQAEGDVLPTTLDFEGTELGTDGLLVADGVAHSSPSGAGVSYQRFDIDVTDISTTGAQAQWQGFVDPQRTASLYLWNTESGQWQPVDSSRGASEEATILSAPVGSAHVDGAVVHALVAGSDPFADDIAKPVDDAFADPEDYDFAIAHYTDTQYLSEGAVENETAEERAVWEKAYTDITQWIVDNREERKIAYAAHTGDIIENWIRATDDEANARLEFEAASRAQKILEDANMPHGVLAGNHDNWTGANHDLYNEYFGPAKYEALAQDWENASFGGSFTEDDNQNHYDLFTAGGLDFIAVYLSFGVDEADSAWANEVLSRYPERNAILLSHAYLTTSSEPNGRNAPYSNADGLYQFRTIVEKNPNIFLTLNGHHHGVGLNVRTNAGLDGNHVVEMLADYQFYEIPADDLGLTEIGGYDPGTTLRFGASFLRLLQFDVDRSELIVDTYSPFLDNFNATEYDLEQRYDGTEDDLVVPIQLTSRSTSIQTDAVMVLAPTGEVIGADEAAAGERVTTLVGAPSLQAWYVEAVTASGGRLTSGLYPAPAALFPDEGTDPEPEPSETPTPDPTDEPTPTPTPSESPTTAPSVPVVRDLYSTPGFHNVGGRWWYTECEPYSQTIRCTTDIWATSVVWSDGRFVSTNGWVFNNLTYLPHMNRTAWGANPLANTGEWTAADGRQWRTECDTALTGRGGCRTWARADVVASEQGADGTWSHRLSKEWVLNNMVRFSS